MLLTVRDAAKLLNTTDKQIYRWVDDGEIPFHKVNDQLRFQRAELLEWATERRLPVAVEMFHDHAEQALPSLADALEIGGVHHHVEGGDREAVLRAVVKRIPAPEDFDRDLLLEVMLAREAMGSTGVGDGIAIPHVRNPVVLDAAAAAVTLCFLEQPVSFNAVDGKPVHTIFSLVSPTIKGHLQLLARLSWALHDAGFRAAIARRAPAEEIIAEARRVEKTLPETR